MINFWTEGDINCLAIKSPLAFFVNLFKKKKILKARKNNDNIQSLKTLKVPTIVSVSVMDMRMNSPCPSAISILTLTPGRTRDIDQDMEALRLSRQDNPYLKVLASRESLVESIFESESDDTNLMSQEHPNESEVDPLSLPEIHEHMIRSPPPTTWPKSPNCKIFRFPASSEENLQENCRQFQSSRNTSNKIENNLSRDIEGISKNSDNSEIIILPEGLKNNNDNEATGKCNSDSGVYVGSHMDPRYCGSNKYFFDSSLSLNDTTFRLDEEPPITLPLSKRLP